MLVLSRREGESITILLEDNREITVTACQINSSGQLKIGVDAPDEIDILRTELMDRDCFLD